MGEENSIELILKGRDAESKAIPFRSQSLKKDLLDINYETSVLKLSDNDKQKLNQLEQIIHK